MEKVIVFGANGMLGKYVVSYLSGHNINVISITREDYDLCELSENQLSELIKKYNPYTIVNCAGIIPQKAKNTDFTKINTDFPLLLSKIFPKVIHISTDCVFDGKIGNYDENSDFTETNIYGVSKYKGESPNATIIRTSIIGEEPINKKGFLEWLLTSKGTITGYNTHFWNGITCLTLAKIIHLIIKTGNFWKGVRHFYSPSIYTKYDLCCKINNIYSLNLNIKNNSGKEKVNKALTSIYNGLLDIPEIDEQILEQYHYSRPICLIGKNGFIGKNLSIILKKKCLVFKCYSHNELDKLKKDLELYKLPIIISCCGKNIDDIFSSNFTTLENISSIIRHINYKHFIYLSSLYINYKNHNGSNEFAIVKQKCEQYIKNNLKNYTILRPCNILGHNHILPYTNNFLYTLYHEKKLKIQKPYNIPNNDIYVLSINAFQTYILKILYSPCNTVLLILSKKYKLIELVKILTYNFTIEEKNREIDLGTNIVEILNDDIKELLTK